MPAAVHGLRELNRTFRNAPKDINRAYKAELRTVADPVKTSAETKATSSIPRIGPKWSRMRVGITTTLVYVAPVPRGVKGRAQQRRRPNLATLLMDRAMQPALEQNQHRIQDDFERMLDRLVTKWGHDGP